MQWKYPGFKMFGRFPGVMVQNVLRSPKYLINRMENNDEFMRI